MLTGPRADARRPSPLARRNTMPQGLRTRRTPCAVRFSPSFHDNPAQAHRLCRNNNNQRCFLRPLKSHALKNFRKAPTQDPSPPVNGRRHQLIFPLGAHGPQKKSPTAKRGPTSKPCDARGPPASITTAPSSSARVPRALRPADRTDSARRQSVSSRRRIRAAPLRAPHHQRRVGWAAAAYVFFPRKDLVKYPRSPWLAFSRFFQETSTRRRHGAAMAAKRGRPRLIGHPHPTKPKIFGEQLSQRPRLAQARTRGFNGSP